MNREKGLNSTTSGYDDKQRLEIFRERLAEILKERGMEQKKLAEMVGVSSKAISAYVRGKADPSLEKFAKIAEALDVSADYLLGLSDEPKPLKQTNNGEPYADEIRTIRKAYRHMSSRERKVVMQLIRGLVGEMDENGSDT